MSTLLVVPFPFVLTEPGGGGEAGPASRTPESQLDQIIDSGITTIVGLLGTDSVTRTEINLLTKLKALEDEG
jgi:beta-aspartyl-dipeptidase (metallo-type)